MQRYHLTGHLTGRLTGRLLGAVGAAGLLLAAAGCSGAKESLGLVQDPPDEFRVVSRSPLAIPPDFTLRPPRPGVARPQEGSATQQARTAVFRATDNRKPSLDAVSGEGRTMGERAILLAAGAAETVPDIRKIIDREARQFDDDEGYFYDVLVFWRDDEPPGEIVDAAAEAKRLRENAALGRSVTAGQTPTIERKKKALFEGLF